MKCSRHALRGVANMNLLRREVGAAVLNIHVFATSSIGAGALRFSPSDLAQTCDCLLTLTLDDM